MLTDEKRKKILAGALAVVMLTGVAGCGNDKDSEWKNDNTAQNNQDEKKDENNGGGFFHGFFLIIIQTLTPPMALLCNRELQEARKVPSSVVRALQVKAVSAVA